MARNTPPLGRRQDRDRLLLQAHAHRYAEAMGPYRADHPVPMHEAHRLLDLRMRREAILACIHDIARRSGEAPRRGRNGNFAMPSIRAMLRWFRRWVLGELLEGRLVANMCLPDGRRVDVDAERAPVSDATLKSWYDSRKKSFDRDGLVPSQRKDEEDAKAKFGDCMSRARVRAMREACAPEWESSGKPKGRAAKKTRT